MKTKISLLLSIFVILSIVLTACGAPAGTQPAATEPAATEPAATEPAATEPGATEPAATEPGATEAPAMPATFQQAPSLEGESLPPVEERLPDTPVVTEVVESIGKYGGTLHTASWWPEVGNVQLYFAVEAPIKWKADLTGYEPALVESYGGRDHISSINGMRLRFSGEIYNPWQSRSTVTSSPISTSAPPSSIATRRSRA